MAKKTAISASIIILSSFVTLFINNIDKFQLNNKDDNQWIIGYDADSKKEASDITKKLNKKIAPKINWKTDDGNSGFSQIEDVTNNSNDQFIKKGYKDYEAGMIWTDTKNSSGNFIKLTSPPVIYFRNLWGLMWNYAETPDTQIFSKYKIGDLGNTDWDKWNKKNLFKKYNNMDVEKYGVYSEDKAEWNSKKNYWDFNDRLNYQKSRQDILYDSDYLIDNNIYYHFDPANNNTDHTLQLILNKPSTKKNPIVNISIVFNASYMLDTGSPVGVYSHSGNLKPDGMAFDSAFHRVKSEKIMPGYAANVMYDQGYGLGFSKVSQFDLSLPYDNDETAGTYFNSSDWSYRQTARPYWSYEVFNFQYEYFPLKNNLLEKPELNDNNFFDKSLSKDEQDYIWMSPLIPEKRKWIAPIVLNKQNHNSDPGQIDVIYLYTQEMKINFTLFKDKNSGIDTLNINNKSFNTNDTSIISYNFNITDKKHNNNGDGVDVLLESQGKVLYSYKIIIDKTAPINKINNKEIQEYSNSSFYDATLNNKNIKVFYSKKPLNVSVLEAYWFKLSKITFPEIKINTMNIISGVADGLWKPFYSEGISYENFKIVNPKNWNINLNNGVYEINTTDFTKNKSVWIFLDVGEQKHFKKFVPPAPAPQTFKNWLNNNLWIISIPIILIIVIIILVYLKKKKF